jgi:DNA-binding response OmpR family regulator
LPLLHIDDSANERHLVREAIFLSGTPFAFFEADDLESAIPFFQSSHRRELEHYLRPAVVLLDYDMGERTGVDFLLWLRSMKKITSVPVVMFSSSVSSRHVAECYANGANHFIDKPHNLIRLKNIVRTLYQSLTTAEHPSPILSLAEYLPDPRLKLAHARSEPRRRERS